MSSVSSNYWYPEKVIIQLGGKGNKENINTSKIKEGLFNLYAPLKNVIKNITQTNEIVYLIEYECDFTDIDANQYSYLLNKAHGTDGFGFGILESLARSLREGYSATYRLSVFDKTDFGLDLDVGALVAGFELSFHAFQNIERIYDEGYVINGNYFPVVKYSTSAPTIDVPTYFINHFDVNFLLNFMTEQIYKTVQDIVDRINQAWDDTKTGVENLGNDAANIVNNLGKETKKAVDNFANGLKQGANYVNSVSGWFGCPVNITIINDEGHIIGYKNGTFVNEIENAYYYCMNNETYFYLPSGSYIFILIGEDTGYYDAQFVVYSDEEIKTISFENLSVTVDTEDIFVPKIDGCSFESNENKPYSLVVENLTNGSIGTFSFSNMSIDAGETHYYEVKDWNQLNSTENSSVLLGIDKDGDGVPEEENNLTNNMSGSDIITQYTLTVSVIPSNAGYITLNPSDGTYDEGTVVTATANANSGYEFDHWSGDASGSNPTVQITMNSNKSITAHFSTIPSPPPNEKPTVTITSPLNGSTVTGTVGIIGTASDTDGTVQSVQVRIDTGSWKNATGTTSWSYSWDTTTVTNGSHTIYARSYDGMDYSSIGSVTVNVNITLSNQPPTVSITSPLNGSTVSGTVTIAGTASDDVSVEKVEIRIGDDLWQEVTGTTSWTYSWDTTSMATGNYDIYARSYDGTD